jgi:hypothetical protein
MSDGKFTAEQLAKKEDRENEKLKAKAYEDAQRIKSLEAQLEQAKEDKRKPGLNVVTEDGEYRRKKRVNSMGISDKMMPPLTKGRTAIYKIIGRDEINPATGLPAEITPTLIPGIYTLYDRFDPDPGKRNKVLQNIVRQGRKIVGGVSTLEDEVEDIVFERGFLQVSVEKEWNLHVFMELHPMNKSNKFRPSNAVAVFERVDVLTTSKASQSVARDLMLDAGNAVRKMEKDEVRAFAAQVVPPIVMSGGRPNSEIKDDLQAWAMANPMAFFKMNKNAEAAIQMNIYDAQNFGLIEYRPDTKSYILTDTEEVLHTHTAAEEPMKSFVKALGKTENKEKYDALLESMGYWKD